MGISDALAFLNGEVSENWRKKLFSEYEMPPLQEIYYAKLAEQDQHLQNVYDHDVSSELIGYIESRVKKCDGDPEHNSNVNFVYVGEQDSGKSTFLVAVYLIYAYFHKKYHNRDVDLKWTFTVAESLEAFTKADFFTMIGQDEDDSLEGKGSRTTYKRVGNVVKRARASGISLGIACPTLARIAGCDYALMPFGFHKKGIKSYKEGNSSHAKGRMLVYCKSRMKDDGYQPLGIIYLPMGHAIKYMKEHDYISKKMASFEEIRESGGASTVSHVNRGKRNLAFAQMLLRAAIENGWNGRAKVDLNAFSDFTEIPPEILEDDREMDKIKSLTMAEFEKERKKALETPKKLQTTFGDFVIDIEQCLQIIENESHPSWVKKKRDLEAYRMMISKTYLGNAELANNQEMKDKYGTDWPIEQSNYSHIRKKVSGYISLLKGSEYEHYTAEEYRKREDVHSVKEDGRKGKPDVVVYFKSKLARFISCKCYDFKNRKFSRPIKDFAPELEYAQKRLKRGSATEVRARILNLFDGKKYIYEFTLEDIKKFPRNKSKKIYLQ